MAESAWIKGENCVHSLMGEGTDKHCARSSDCPCAQLFR